MAELCICVRPDGVVEVHEMPAADPIVARLIRQDLELSCVKVECSRDSVLEVVVDGQK